MQVNMQSKAELQFETLGAMAWTSLKKVRKTARLVNDEQKIAF